jgi:predicted dehydrogenase
MLQIGIIGNAESVSIESDLLDKISGFKSIGYYPLNVASNRSGCEVMLPGNVNLLLNKAEAFLLEKVDNDNYLFVQELLKKSKHIFICNPITGLSPSQLQVLIKLRNEANVAVKVFNAAQYNPAFLSAKAYFSHPLHIQMKRYEKHRHQTAQSNILVPKLVNDIDLLIDTVKSNIIRVNAHGISIMNHTKDIVNAILELDNGCVINLTLNLVAEVDSHDLTIYQMGKTIKADLNNKTAKLISMNDVDSGHLEDMKVNYLSTSNNLSPAKEEVLDEFYYLSTSNSPVNHDLERYYHVLKTVSQIIEKMDRITAN